MSRRGAGRSHFNTVFSGEFDHREDEAFWLLEGHLTVRCGEKTFTTGPGSYTFLPRDIPHTFAVEGETPARLLSTAAR